MFADARTDTRILAAAASLLALALLCGLRNAETFWLLLAGAAAVAVAGLALLHPVGFSVAWLLVAGMSLEMTLHDVVGEEAYQPAIAAVKGAEVLIAALTAVRCGLRLDALNPVWAYVAMLLVGFAHGLYPGLTVEESARSFIGSATPFVFCFCRLPPRWPSAVVRAVKWCPIAAVACCVPLAAAGIRPLFVESGGARLAGLGHPAFLAGVCLPAVYACLVRLFQDGRRGDAWLLGANFLLLGMTGARAPLAYAVAVTAASFVSIPSAVFPARTRLLMGLAAGCAAPLLLLVASDTPEVRLFNVVANEAINLSGRDLLWPVFEQAAGGSPWFGWGVGAGNVVIPADGRIVKILHTWAAHNEYLRMEVEGGQFGRTLLIGLFAAWVVARSRALPLAERRIVRLVFVAFACHAATDNVLISTPACVLFAFSTAVFAGGGRAAGLAVPGKAGATG